MQILRWISVVIVAFAVTGCVKVDQTLTLNPDGSGTLDLEYGMSEQAIAQIESMQQMGQAMQESGGEAVDFKSDMPFDIGFKEEQVREEFEAQGLEGVELVSANAVNRDGWRYMKLEIAFDNLAALKQTDYFDDSELSLTQDAEGNYVLTQRSEGGSPNETDDMDPQMLKQMAAMFAGMEISNHFVVPTEIIETNATQLDGRTASWVYDIGADPTVLTQLQNFDMRVVFSSNGASIPLP
jgi:hypothetical protein